MIAAAGVAIGLGTYSGGWRVMQTMGEGLVEIQAPQGFAAETASTATTLASSHLGFGLSATHVCSGSILGSGVGRNLAEVKWTTARKMLHAWLLTPPAAGLIGAVAAFVANSGTAGTVIMLVLLIVAAAAIWTISRQNRVSSANVSDSHEVVVAPARVTSSV